MAVNEIVIISGKGGTGKTTLTASIIPFLDQPVLADCDVDAPDLHLLLAPELKNREEFFGTNKAEVAQGKCTACGECTEHCRFGALELTGETPEKIHINRIKCEGCGVCEFVCPTGAIKLAPASVGEIFESETAYGPMSHARLIPGEETSGKLASAVRSRAKEMAEEEGRETIIVDGSPGIGCSVISSITGADLAIIVTEPSLSGLHDLERVYRLCQRLNVPARAVVNKWDLSPELFEKIEKFCDEEKIPLSLKIPFNRDIVQAVTHGKIPSLTEEKFYESIGFKTFITDLQRTGV
ncbi:MAG: ATP-binding protein [Spirochaetales bacterium]|nr:ATP-binding protein [Spirochaetales bacterium]